MSIDSVTGMHDRMRDITSQLNDADKSNDTTAQVKLNTLEQDVNAEIKKGASGDRLQDLQGLLSEIEYQKSNSLATSQEMQRMTDEMQRALDKYTGDNMSGFINN